MVGSWHVGTNVGGQLPKSWGSGANVCMLLMCMATAAVPGIPAPIFVEKLSDCTDHEVFLWGKHLAVKFLMHEMVSLLPLLTTANWYAG